METKKPITNKKSNKPKNKKEVDDFTKYILMLSNDNDSSNNDKTNKQELLLKVIDQLFSTDNIDVKTEYNDRQIVALTKAEIFAIKYNSDVLKRVVKLIPLKSVSKSRGSRKEVVAITQALNNIILNEDDQRPTLKERFIGSK